MLSLTEQWMISIPILSRGYERSLLYKSAIFSKGMDLHLIYKKLMVPLLGPRKSALLRKRIVF